jgi:hypothetical protein
MPRTDTPFRLACGMLAAALVLPAHAGEADLAMPAPSVAAPSPAAARSPAEQRMRADQARFNETVLGGLMTGALVGAGTAWLASVLRGRQGADPRKAALAGGIAGGIAGGHDGYVVATKEQAGREKVRELQAATADVRGDNERLQAFIDSANAVLAEGRARLAALSADVAARRITAQQARQERQREEQNIAAMQSTLDNAKKTREQYQQASAKFKGTPQDRRDLDAEIARMDRQVSQLEGNIDEYSRALAVSRA